jgi:hypothetical protein
LKPKQLRVLQQAADLGVRTRYSVDVFFMLSHEDPRDGFFHTGKVTSTLENDDWMREFYRVVGSIFEASGAASKRACQKHRWTRGPDIPTESNRMKTFFHAIGIKP